MPLRLRAARRRESLDVRDRADPAAPIFHDGPDGEACPCVFRVHEKSMDKPALEAAEADERPHLGFAETRAVWPHGDEGHGLDATGPGHFDPVFRLLEAPLAEQLRRGPLRPAPPPPPPEHPSALT